MERPVGELDRVNQPPHTVIASILTREKRVTFLACRAHTGVAIRVSQRPGWYVVLSRRTDCHTSDIGHWFAMTKTGRFCFYLRCSSHIVDKQRLDCNSERMNISC